MQKFIIYNLNGSILRTGQCTEDSLNIQTDIGEFLLLGTANDATQMIVNGEVVDKPIVIPPYDLEAEKLIKSLEIKYNCEAQIINGFTSSALGATYTYPSNDRDQVNLSGAIQKSLLANAQPVDFYPFPCEDANGVWGYLPHTALQIQQVGSDAYNAILGARVKNATLQAQIEVATTQAELEAILW